MKKNKILLFLASVSFILVSISYLGGFFDSWQDKIYDRMFVKQTPEVPVIIIAIDDTTLDEIGPWPLKRSHYAELLTHLKQATMIGFDMFFAEESRYGSYDDDVLVEAIKSFPKPVVIPFEIRDRGGVGVPLFAKYEKVVETVPYANIQIDSDGIARRGEFSRDGYESFAYAMADRGSVNNHFRINYLGPEKTILTVPMIDVLNGKLSPDFFKDAYVLVGVTSNSLHDIVITPFGYMAGVEAHANIIHTIVADRFFSKTPLWLILFSFLLIHLAIYWIVSKNQSLSRIIIWLGIVLVVTQIGPITSFYFDNLIPSLYIFLSFVLPSAVLITSAYISESKEKRFIEDTFKYYLMPDVINDLKEHPEKLKLGGENREVTILFSDIRGFTTISEKLSAEELTRVINEYLTAMTDIIMEEKGLVDKYIGDAIMAFWGAPVDNPDQAICSARAVIKMSEKLKKMNIDWAKRGVPELGIGIGLNKGQVIVGNMGSSKRFNYTIMGDEVNFGSRLEGLNKMYGTECIVSESVANSLRGKGFVIRELDYVMVKGKKEPKKIFELISGEVGNDRNNALDMFAKGFEAYKKGDWDVALNHFNEALVQYPDKPSQVFKERTEKLKSNPPTSWTGAYEHTSK